MPVVTEARERAPRPPREFNMEIPAVPQSQVWKAIESFPLNPYRTIIELNRGFAYPQNVEDVEAALEAGFVAGSSLNLSYDSDRKVIKTAPEMKLPYVGGYWFTNLSEENKATYAKEAELVKAIRKSMMAGARPNAMSFDMGRDGLAVFREDLEQLKSFDYKVRNLQLWLDSYSGTGYNQGSETMSSGLNFLSFHLDPKPMSLYVSDRDLKPLWSGRQPNISAADAITAREWFKSFKASVKAAGK